MTTQETPAEDHEPAPEGLPAAQHVGKVVSDIIAAHAPVAAEAVAKATTAARAAFLDELEGENARVIRPLIDKLMATESLPEELRPLLASIAGPEKAVGGIIGSFLVYGVLFQVAATTLQPFFQALQNDLWALNPVRPLSPADVANMVVQGYMDEAAGEREAGLSGINPERFDLMVDVTGVPPSPQDLLEMFRRDIIAQGTSAEDPLTVYSGLAQGHTKDEWIPHFQQLGYTWPSPVDFVAAAVRDQMDYETAALWANAAGLDATKDLADPPSTASIGNDTAPPDAATGVPAPPSFFRMLYDVAGRPPGPEQAAAMAWRGIIDWTGSGPQETTFAQAIAESDVKTKWTDALEALSGWVPPIGEVLQLYSFGLISATDETGGQPSATTLLTCNRVPPGLIPLLLASVTARQVEPDVTVVKNDILTKYIAGNLDEATAAADLEAVGFTAEASEILLDIAQWRRLETQVARIIEQVGRTMITGRINVATATASLEALGLPAQQTTQLISDWQAAQALEVPVATAAQIASAVYYGVEDAVSGMNDLIAIGYSPYQAWRVLSIRLHAPIDLQPLLGQGAPAGWDLTAQGWIVRPGGAQV